MANKALALGAATIGGIMIYSGLSGTSVMDVLAGNASLQGVDPKGGKGLPSNLLDMLKGGGGTDTLVSPGELGAVQGEPRTIINEMVLPLARKHHMVTGRNAAMVDAANAVHGPTVDGNQSDHQGPPETAWAADMSNGVMTKEEMALAHDLADRFHITVPKKLNGIYNSEWGGYRFQLIHGCGDCGGDHTNHVHFGVRCLKPPCHDPKPAPKPHPFSGMHTS